MTPLLKSIWIDAPVEAVFPYFTDADKIVQWSGIRARLEPIPGGLYELDMGTAGLIRGRFKQVQPPTFLSYEIESPAGMQDAVSLVEVSLHSEGGGTRVQISHSGLPQPYPIIAGRGWEHHLARLSVTANGGNPGRDTLCERPMQSLMD